MQEIFSSFLKHSDQQSNFDDSLYMTVILSSVESDYLGWKSFVCNWVRLDTAIMTQKLVYFAESVSIFDMV